jgi:ketosteroid isomerase-like protein
MHGRRPRWQHAGVLLRPGRVRDREEGHELSLDPRAVAESYLASFAGGDAEAIAAHVSEDFSNVHTSALGDPCQGRAAYRERLPGFLASFEGIAYEPEEIIVEGNRVAAAYVMRARYNGTPIQLRGVFRLVIRNGLVTHRTDYFDSLTFLRQTGQA